jgi:hypothetical protein
MTDQNPSSDSHERRSVLKALGIGGLAATGVGAAAGSATAQSQNLQIDSDNLLTSQSLLTISLQNTNVLNNVNVEDVLEDVTVTIQNIDVDVSDVVDVGDVTVLTVNVDDALNDLNLDALNTVDVQVSVLGTNLSGTDTVQVVQ